MKEKQTSWAVKTQPAAAIDALCQALSLEPLLARLLYNRGLQTPEAASAFLALSVEGLHDPFLLQDMDKAVLRIGRALEQNEQMLIYGDYDVDGVTAVCLLYRALRAKGARVRYRIPRREGEGYGLSEEAILRAGEEGVKLIVTVDTGITAVREAKRARELGMDLIITDHHECGGELPQAAAVINPKRAGSSYPFSELCGAGVALKLVCALERETPLETLLERYGQMAALGTVADVMPLTGENRILVAYGLRQMQKTDNLGLRALMEQAGVGGRRVTASTVGFQLCPRINAAGRMGCADQAAELLLTDDPERAEALAQALCASNRQRQETENKILGEAMEQIAANPDWGEGGVLVMGSAAWHQGVIGIVASRLCEKYGKPTILFAFDGETGKGSGRSVPGFSLYEALTACGEHLLQFGGHALAAGMSIRPDELGAFRLDINHYAASHGAKETAEAAGEADCVLEAEEITLGAAKTILLLEPYGMGNPTPLFLIEKATVDEMVSMGHDKHMRLALSKDGRGLEAVYFGHTAASVPLCAGDSADVICNMDVNCFRDRESVQLVVRDIFLSHEQREAERQARDCYRRFAAGGAVTREELAGLFPSREEFAAVYRVLRSTDGKREPAEVFFHSLERRTGGLSYGKLRLCLQVFEEMGLLTAEQSGEALQVTCLKTTEKINLEDSVCLKNLRKRLK